MLLVLLGTFLLGIFMISISIILYCDKNDDYKKIKSQSHIIFRSLYPSILELYLIKITVYYIEDEDDDFAVRDFENYHINTHIIRYKRPSKSRIYNFRTN